MRTLILALLLFLLAIPFLFGTPFAPRTASHNPSTPALAPESPRLPGNRDQWLEFARVMAGAFAGAGAAFLANLQLQRRARRLDQLAAGNAAMATLTRQYNAFLAVRRLITEEFARCGTEGRVFPTWLVFRPPLQFNPDDVEVDFDSLSFLYEHGDFEFFQRLHLADAVYRDIMGFTRQLTIAATLKQDRLQAAGFMGDRQNMNLAAAQAAIGPKLIAEIEGLIEHLPGHCEQDKAIYLEAASALYRVLSSQLRGEKIIRLVA